MLSGVAGHPRATVAALAEGFQTSSWRVSAKQPAAQFNWISVDLPPVIVKRIAPKGPRSPRLYRVPPMPGAKARDDVPMPTGRGLFFEHVFPTLWRFRPVRRFRSVYALLEFG